MMRNLKDQTGKLMARHPELHKEISILLHNLFNRVSTHEPLDGLH